MAEKINIRGTMNKLEVGDEFMLPKFEYRYSSVLVTASALFYDFGKRFTVTRVDGGIAVKRII